MLLFSRRDLTKIIVPLLIEQALGVTIGMLDSVMVSSAGEAAVSGVSLVDTLNLLLVYLFSALAGGGSIIISQLMGKEDYRTANVSAKQLIWVVFGVALLVMTASLTFRVPLLNLIFGSIDADVMQNAQIYFLFTAMSYPFLGLYHACAAIFRAMGNSRVSMFTSILMNLINVTGNALLIFVFHMGAAGAAIATLFARLVGALIMLVLVHDKRRIIHVEKMTSFRPQWALIKQICRVGIPNGIENAIFQFGKVITQSLISTFATVQIAANAVGNSLTSLQYIPGGAIGLAMVIVVGRCIGAGEKEQAKYYAKKLVGLTYLILIVMSLVMALFSGQLVGMYSLSEEAAGLASQIVIFHSVSAAVIWPIAFTLPSAFRAASDVRYTMLLSISSMWVFRVGLSYLFAYVFDMGVISVWAAMICDWIFRALFFGARYLRGTWLTKYKGIVAAE